MGRATKGKSKGTSLEVIKASYKFAKDNGDKEEEARWANQIGHAFKDRGEYVTALKWFRKDYEMSSSGSGAVDPVKLMPTCQSIGEVYLRLENYDDALTYQQKHFHWAEQAGDTVEQQRASTQLGRTYLELYEVKERLSGLTDAKAYFQTALDLAQRLRTDPPAIQISPSGFVVEHVDAYNNLGLSRAMAEDYKQALKLYLAGLKLCDEEEVDENDAARSRIHHNLGRLYTELRSWDKAKYHTELDIEICQKIPHAQGEAKGLMNLADLYFKSQDYEQAARCYKRALHIAQTLEDEDALCSQIKSNMEVLGQARAKTKAFDSDMQKLSKLRREVESSKGTAAERKFIKQECALLLELTSRAEELQSWEVHLGLAKRLKKLTKELRDTEKLGDAFEIVAASYYSLRNFERAMKWHLKSFDLCKRIGHLEGQIVAKINYGNALDASGNAEAALKAYQEALEAAKTCGGVKMLPQQISALDNIHYSYFVRLERLDEARKVELQLKQLRYEKTSEAQDRDDGDERCSETESEGSGKDCAMPAASVSSSQEDSSLDILGEGKKDSEVPSRISKVVSDSDDDNAPLASIKPQIRNRRLSQRISIPPQQKTGIKRGPGSRPVSIKHSHVQETENPLTDCRQRVVSDDGSSEGSMEIDLGRREASKPIRGSAIAVHDLGITTLAGDKVAIGSKRNVGSSSERHHDAAEQHVILSSEDDDLPIISRKRRKLFNNSSSGPSSWSTDHLRSLFHGVEAASTSPCNTHLNSQNVKIPELGSKDSDKRPKEKSVEAAAQAKTSEPKDDESFGRVATRISSPVADFGAARATGYSSHLNDPEVTRTNSNYAQGWTTSSLLESYLNHCSATAVHIPPNPLLVEKLRSQKVRLDRLQLSLWCPQKGFSRRATLFLAREVSEEVVVAGCILHDSDARPLLASLGESDAFSLLDMSHNLLGNATVHAIQELIKSTDQADLGLTLDLHCNRLGAGALLEICRCPVSLSRLEVLNLSGNRLTDAAARHLSKILKESQALATLNLESCALTTRAIAQLTSALHPESRLNKLCIGNNTPIASHAIQELLQQLSTLPWFSHLDLKGLELDGAAVACLCTFLEKSKSITTLILRNSEIRNEGALAIAEALSNPSHCLETLDLSLNGFNNDPAVTICTRVTTLQRLSELNLSGNNLGEMAVEALAQSLARVNCRLKVLDLSKCHLGPSGVLRIMQGAREQANLLDLNLAENIERVQFQLPPEKAPRMTLEEPCSLTAGTKGEAKNSCLGKVSKTITIEESTEDLQSSQTEPLGEIAGGVAGKQRAGGLAGGPAGELGGQLAGELAEDPAGEIAGRLVGGLDGRPTGGPTEGLAGEMAGESAGDLTGGGAGDLSDGGLGAQQSDQGTEGNVSSHAAQTSSTNFRDRIPEAIHRGTNYAPEGIQLYVSLESDEPGAAAEQIPTAGFREEGVRKVEHHDISRTNVQPVHTRPRQLEIGLSYVLESNSSGLDAPSTTSSWAKNTFKVFCEQFSASIRKAKGLQRLDLSNNEIHRSDIDALYLGWSACPRGNSDHERHVDGTVVHFSVKGRPCPCGDPPCCASL